MMMPNNEDQKRESALELLRRRRARVSFHDFCEFIRPDFFSSEFSRTVARSLDSFWDAFVQGCRPTLILAAPPQHGKTEMVSRLLPAYLYGLDPTLRIGAASYGALYASKINREVQAILLSHRYHLLFPESSLLGHRLRRNNDGFDVPGGGRYDCTGVEGPLTGYSLDLAIIDDPIKNNQDALSPAKKDSVWDWYTSVVRPRMASDSGTIVMATRWAQDDLSGRILEKQSGVASLSFPAIDDDGNALVPELHPIDQLLEIKSTMSDYFWSALYQGSPIPDDGGDFDVNKIEIVDAVPAGIDWVRGWDFAASTKKHADYTATALLGIHAGVVYIGHVDAIQRSPSDVLEYIQKRVKDDGDVYQSFPQDPGAAGKYVVNTIVQMLHGHRMEFTPETGDKRTRAIPFASQVDAGNVRVLRGSWNDSMMEQMAYFPNGSHDDIVDALSRAYNVCTSRRSVVVPSVVSHRVANRVKYR